ncbi:coiled-coil domain-containing protein 137 [Chanos chanos]|uniref:Coiled-coil domain-containing protein 137 n=1 Tax=Chanos chanos TaxID=29144 RepID=A0A6J2WPL2_CHACN|nr:coiled-coil domain-containing protein 137 [Chanos chanos]
MAKNKQTTKPESSNQAQKKENHQRGKKKQRKDVKPRQEEHLQQIPFRLREIMKSKERMKLGSSKIKKMRKAAMGNLQGGQQKEGDIPVPHFRRGKTESEGAYLRRMSRETEHVLFLTNNQVERQPELETGNQESVKEKQKSEKKKEHDKGRLQKLHKRKTEKREEKEEKEFFTDEVQFGEVAMAPPSLSAKPKKAPVKPQGAPKGLLLNSLLGQTTLSTAKPSIARQRIIEEERERVVQVYRNLKKQKLEQQEQRNNAKNKLKTQ